MEEEQLPDRDDFGGGDFLEDLGGLEGLGDVPSVGDITLEGALREENEETSKSVIITHLVRTPHYILVSGG